MLSFGEQHATTWWKILIGNCMLGWNAEMVGGVWDMQSASDVRSKPMRLFHDAKDYDAVINEQFPAQVNLEDDMHPIII